MLQQDEGPPPLEDCTQMLASRKVSSSYPSLIWNACPQPSAALPSPAPSNRSVVQVEQKTKIKTRDATTLVKTGSSLFKSGFLLNTPNRNGNPTSSAKSDDIIRPQQSREEELRIQDVQDAIQSDRIQQEFTSDSFLQNALNDPAVASLLASDDPEIQLAIQVFSQNPALALTQFAHRADVIEALKSFAGHFGNHLTRLSETPSVQAKSKAQTDTNDESRLQPLVQIPQELDQSEKDLIKRVMADREVQSALKDVRVQQVMLKMKAGDPEGYRLLRTYSQDADMQHKIRKLVQVGLLQFQS